MEAFLEEQLKRIQHLAEQMSSLESSLERHTAEAAYQLDRERASLSHGPLADVKDLRTYKNSVRDTADERPRPRAAARSHKRRRR